jgi:hypothetical protein
MCLGEHSFAVGRQERDLVALSELAGLWLFDRVRHDQRLTLDVSNGNPASAAASDRYLIA